MSEAAETPDVPVFMIARFEVTDADTYRQYEKGFFPILKRYDGQFHTFDDNVHVFEGDPAVGRTVVFQFPSEEKAKAWYNDPDYQAIAEHRWAGTTNTTLIMVHGLPPRT